jgi:hypothetical protein
MRGFVIVTFYGSTFFKKVDDIPILPIGSTVYFAKDCCEGASIQEYALNLDGESDYVFCYLESIYDGPATDCIGGGSETWEQWLLGNGYKKGLPE